MVVAEYSSLSRLCVLLQHSPARIQSAAQELGLKPALMLDLTVYFDDVQIEAISGYFRDPRQVKHIGTLVDGVSGNGR